MKAETVQANNLPVVFSIQCTQTINNEHTNI